MADWKSKVGAELHGLIVPMVFFAVWFGFFVTLKQLILAEYAIAFRGLSKMVVGALVLSKVVLILEHVPLGSWVARRPAWLDVVLRTSLYAVGVLVVLVVERAFETRHEHGGFAAAVGEMTQGVHRTHILTTALCVTAGLLSYNILSVIRDAFGKGSLARVFAKPREMRGE